MCARISFVDNWLVVLENVTKVYRSGSVDVVALRGVSLRVAPGEFVAIMGASGSGKSTMMHILGCLDRPSSGRYLLEGEPVSEKTTGELAEIRNRRIGFVFQQFNLLSRTTVFENVELPLLYVDRIVAARERRERVMSALEKVGLADKAWKVPSQLSGGEQQRVAIARSLINSPALVLADEPTGALDSRTGYSIMETFAALNEQGHTVVLVTHEMDIARFAARRITLRDGQVMSDERIAERLDARRALAELDR